MMHHVANLVVLSVAFFDSPPMALCSTALALWVVYGRGEA